MHTLALISNMMSKCLNLDSLKCSLISVILLCVQFGVVDYDPGTHDQKTKSVHFFEDKQKSKIVELCSVLAVINLPCYQVTPSTSKTFVKSCATL